ncbi:MAG TPA: DUF4920 domain-containing protein [Chitinophagaceae bacterium]|jgi:hypothetical protein|nr:DUF4920 domain-containing protein [Chitinophagaceae bacterium]
MKRLFLTLAIAGFAFMAQAQPPAGDAKPGDFYGDKVNPDGALNINDVVAKLNGGSEFGDVKITAKITEVCPKKGCWVKLALSDGSTATVKMKDYGFFLPVAAVGKTVVIDGEVKMKTTSVAELKHYAEDAKKSKEEIDAIKEPQKEVRVMAKGIVVVQ